MALVEATSDIVRGENFTVARKGDEGTAVTGVIPHEKDNLGRVLVYFKGRKRGYWVEPEKLSFKEMDQKHLLCDYIATLSAAPAFSCKLPAGRGLGEDFRFGDNLRFCRKARGMTQAQLGKRMGSYGLPLAQSTICYRESSPSSPGGRFVKAASRALDVPPFALFVPLSDCEFMGQVKKFRVATSSSLCGDNR